MTITEIITQLGMDEETFRQDSVIHLIENPMSKPWTCVYNMKEEPSIFSCFASKSLREQILAGQSWLRHSTDFTPGLSMCGDDVSYESGLEGGFEYIVAELYFHSLETGQLHLNVEFLLLLGLYRGDDGNYYEVNECGEKTPAVRFEDGRVMVKTSCLLTYMAAKQLLYVQFIDSRVSSSEHYPFGAKEIAHLVQQGNNFNYFISLQSTKKHDFLFSLIYARSIVDPPAIEECHLPPYEEDEEYPEFIIEELPNGEYRRFTCEEDKLGNYFGGNPDAPHYLTPVYFKPAVLDKYRKNPLFDVSEYHLSCGTQWRLEIDNADPSRVMVYLGDLGRDLPACERSHFLSYEMSPYGQHVSEDVVARDFFNVSSDPTGPVTKLVLAREHLNDQWAKKYGRELYRSYHDEDSDLEQRIRVPEEGSTEEFETVIISLSRMLVDYIDESQFACEEAQGSLNKLERFLTDRGINVNLKPLRTLQELRSTGVAHSKGRAYDKARRKYLTGSQSSDIQTMLDELTTLLEQLAVSIENQANAQQTENS